MIKYLKNLLNNDSVSEEIVSTKTKYEEIHFILDSLDSCRDFAEKRALEFESNKVKINNFNFKDQSLKGYKVIPFTDFTKSGEKSTVHIYKIIKQK